MFVQHDPVFAEGLKIIRERDNSSDTSAAEILKLKNALAQSFAITIDELEFFLFPLYRERIEKSTELDYDPTTGRFTISFDRNTNKAELLDEWQQFELLRGHGPAISTKRKAPELPRLIYAIFKAKQKNMDFEHIFKLYQSGSLPGFKGSSIQFLTKESLRRYYNKYKP